MCQLLHTLTWTHNLTSQRRSFPSRNKSMVTPHSVTFWDEPANPYGPSAQGTTAQALTYCANSCSHLCGEIIGATVERSSRERRRW
jgi:hypothetical protein